MNDEKFANELIIVLFSVATLIIILRVSFPGVFE